MSDEMAAGLAKHRERQAKKKPSEVDARQAMFRLRATRDFARYVLQITDVGDLSPVEACKQIAAIREDDIKTIAEALPLALTRLHMYATSARDLAQEGL